jgi:phosphoglycerate-specific signal transduction histidine kinase
MKAAPPEECDPAQRAAIIRRLQKLLNQQCECFHSYLTVLEKQHACIESGSEDSILAHLALEEQRVAEIITIQKVIEPLEIMYRNAGSSPAADDSIPALKVRLEELYYQTKVQSERNRERLSGRISDIRADINVLRNNPLVSNARRSLFSGAGTASIIDIKG